MPKHERVQQLIQYVESGRTEEALELFYTEDTIMAENLSDPTKGRAANLERQRAFRGTIGRVNEYRAEAYLVGEDHSAVHWILDVTTIGGQRLRLDEIAWQKWRGDRICEERFVYDPSTVLIGAEAAPAA